MPPRSAKRKKPSPATDMKSTPETKPADTVPSPLDRNDVEMKIEEQELEAPATEEAEQVGETVTGEGEMKQKVVEEEREIKEEAAEGSDYPLEPNSWKKVTVAAQINGTETFGYDIKVPTPNDDNNREGGDDKIEINQDVSASVDIGTEEVVVCMKEEVVEEEQERLELNRTYIEGEAPKGNECPLEPNSCKEVTVAAQIDGSETFGDAINVLILNDGDDGEAGNNKSEKDPEEIMYRGGRGEENPEEATDSNHNNGKNTNHEEHPLMVIDGVVSNKKKDKNLEIFIPRLDKKTVEDDLIEVFGKFGQIKSVRVVRNKTTNKSKGFGFVQYASTKQAESAISASEGGIEVRGKLVKASMSNDNNNVLFLGNICRLWTKERILETLKNFGIENVESLRLPDDPHKEGRTRGYAFLEFETHSDAVSAFERLSKPDAIFGRDESARVSFSRTPLHPNEDALSQGKTVYVEDLPNAWTEVKVKEICVQYGEVEEIKLSRTLGKKRKDYGFISFSTQDGAHACMKGFRNVFKVKATIARLAKCRPLKHELHGGFKVEKESEVPTTDEGGERENRDASSNMNVEANSVCAKGKGKMLAEEVKMTQVVAEAGGSGKSNENQAVSKNQHAQASLKSVKAKGKSKNLHMKAERRGMSDSKSGRKGKTSEKAQGKNERNQSTVFGKRKRDTRARKGSNRNANFGTYRSQYSTGHGVPVVHYEGHSYNTLSGSKRPHAYMEPYSGYLEHVARKQDRGNIGHFEPPAALHYPTHARTQYHPHGGHLQAEVETYHHTRSIYQNPPIQVRYVDPALGTHAQPHAGYLQPASGNSSHNLHGATIGRGGRQDLHGVIPSVYGTGSSLPPSYPPSFSQHYTSNVGYEVGSTGGAHYQTSGVHQPRPGTYY